ncbi:MAG: DUF1292 domain-containing protein [Acutalibacteraceae bacterium]
MSDILDLLNDDDLDNTVKITDTDGVTAVYDFLDIIFFLGQEFLILDPEDGDGYVDIFRVLKSDGKESYERVTDEKLLDKVFDLFRRKNEDEFDFE